MKGTTDNLAEDLLGNMSESQGFRVKSMDGFH